MEPNADWFDKTDLRKQNPKPLFCPRCGAAFRIGPIFDHDCRECLNCGTSLIEWNTLKVVIVFDKERSPDLYKALFSHLEPLTEFEAYHQVMSLLETLGVEQIACHHATLHRSSTGSTWINV